ncbi:MAG TPA: HIT family protein [Flavilitoribacter sp.]|nr:HIT family protein [Flavilitoribacter sp.]HMQ86689.1 HIT family protein [Flavilitoribacter sp.]
MGIVSPEEGIIYEDEDTIVIFSLDPISKGHVIIKPKEKHKDIDELPEKLLNKILKLTQCYVRLLKSRYLPKGYSIQQADIQSCRMAALLTTWMFFICMFFQDMKRVNLVTIKHQFIKLKIRKRFENSWRLK